MQPLKDTNSHNWCVQSPPCLRPPYDGGVSNTIHCLRCTDTFHNFIKCLGPSPYHPDRHAIYIAAAIPLSTFS